MEIIFKKEEYYYLYPRIQNPRPGITKKTARK